MTQLTINNQTLQITPEQFEIVKKAVLFDRIKETVRKEEDQIAFNQKEAVEEYLNSKGESTRNQYRFILNHFIEYLDNKTMAQVTPQIADQYIRDLILEGTAPRTVNSKISCISGFYNMMIRWEKLPKNPFTGAKLPKATAVRELAVPTDKEFKALVEGFLEDTRLDPFTSQNRSIINASKKMVAVITFMADTGIRVGGLDGVEIREGNVYHTISKGKEYRGKFSDGAKRIIEEMGFSMNVGCHPFEGVTKAGVWYMMDKKVTELRKRGLISSKLHAHSFRHFFATKNFNGDIYTISRLLNHSNVKITENYLKSMDVLKVGK